jgi:hypothetical protein
MNRLKEEASLKREQDYGKRSFITAMEYGKVNITATASGILQIIINPARHTFFLRFW